MCFRHCSFLVLAVFLFVRGADAQDQKISGGCGANVKDVTHSTINVDCGQQNKPVLSFNYSRLFGAMEVPLLMDMIPIGRYQDSDIGHGYKTFVSPNGRSTFPDENQQVTHRILVRYRNQYPFRDAHPIQTPLWNDIAGDYSAAENITLKAAGGHRSELLCYFLSSVIDPATTNSAFLEKIVSGKLPSHCDGVFRRANQRVGFTFLIIQNVSSSPLDDVKLFHRQTYLINRYRDEMNDYYNENDLLHGYVKLMERAVRSGPTSGDPVANLVGRFGKARELEFDVHEKPQEFMVIARLEPGDKLIALLNIYIADENNLPATYLYGIYDFEEVTYSLSGVAHQAAIRRPSKERAARVKGPFGWFQQ